MNCLFSEIGLLRVKNVKCIRVAQHLVVCFNEMPRHTIRIYLDELGLEWAAYYSDRYIWSFVSQMKCWQWAFFVLTETPSCVALYTLVNASGRLSHFQLNWNKHWATDILEWHRHCAHLMIWILNFIIVRGINSLSERALISCPRKTYSFGFQRMVFSRFNHLFNLI